MRLVEDAIKLDFCDVLIKPKRSELVSRKDVDLRRRFTFKHSKKTWEGVPIVAANMDGVGTVAMHERHGGFEMVKLYHGDCLELLKTLPDNSVDSIVTDPPAGISFLNRSWDDDKGGRDHWIAWMCDVMKECHRVLKCGGHGLVWALPRTSHWTATALENAGFEIRDRVSHLFGTGFPKNMDVSKSIDSAAGVEREIIGVDKTRLRPNRKYKSGAIGKIGGNESICDRSDNGATLTAPATPEAKQWEGWGTALKPACEDWWLIRKPLSEKTVAANVVKVGVGGINIDGCRIGSDVITTHRILCFAVMFA